MLRPSLALTVAATLLATISACGTGRGSAPSSPPPSSAASASASPTATRAGAWSGLRWSAPAPIGGRDTLYDIVPWRDGYVAVGQSTENARYVGAAFASADGLRWRRTTTFAVNPGLVATGTRLVAFAHHEGPPPSTEMWVSADGETWTVDERLALAGASVNRAVARGETIVAWAVDAGGRSALWRSVDGAAWARAQPLPGRAVVRELAVGADGFLALGRDGDEDVRSGGVGVAGVGVPAAWWSADGAAWSALHVEGTPAAGAQLTLAFAVASGYFAAGSDTTDAIHNPRTPLLWASTDGRDWRLVGPPEHWGDAGSNGRQAVIFSRKPTGGALGAWISEDGRAWSDLAFSGDTADIPPFDQSIEHPARIDGILVTSRGVLVVGQRGGVPVVWSAEAVH